jgi:hypothetical protein
MAKEEMRRVNSPARTAPTLRSMACTSILDE